MAEKIPTINFNGPIYNNGGTINGDIINPTYKITGNGESFSIDEVFDGRCGGIGEEKQFWILVVAAKARRIEVKNIPDFINAVFDKWSIPFDKTKCISSTQELLKGQEWQTISDQTGMLNFIKTLRKQPNQLAQDLQVANNVFIALKGVIIP